jgi:alpha-methylacyl-CoA racemase
VPHQSPENPVRSGPLTGLTVIDLSRLAPGPYCTMLLADLGADVIVVGGGRAGVPIPEFARGKRFISLDLKADAGRGALQALVAKADVLVEGFRPGVADRIGAGYETLSALNPRLVYCALTGYGQTGPRALDAGHDINYLAVSGGLTLGPAGDRPYPPLNLLADFAGGSLTAAFGILAAVIQARATGRGQYIDAAMIDGVISLQAMHFPLWQTVHWPRRGVGLLAGDKPFYRTYACADGRFVAVGALERGFFVALWQKLGLGEAPDHMAAGNWPEIEARLSAAFLTRSRDGWSAFFLGTDCCVTPVLDPHEVFAEPQIAHRHPTAHGASVPVVPRMADVPVPGSADLSDSTTNVLAAFGLDAETIAAATLLPEETAMTGLSWPPPFGY